MGSVRVRSHVATRSPSHVLLPVSFSIILTGEILILLRSREREIVWLCFMLLFMRYFLLTGPEKKFVADYGAVHSMHCLTRGDVGFYAVCMQLKYLQWWLADTVNVRFQRSEG